MENILIKELYSIIESWHGHNIEELKSRAGDILFEVFSEVKHLEETISEKNSLIEKYAKEKKNLIDKLNTTIDSEKKAYEKLTDLDVTRHVDIEELRQELEQLKTEKEGLIKKVDEITKERAKRDKEANELRDEVEIKKLQLKEYEDDLFRLTGTLHALEAEHERLKDENSSLQRGVSYINSLLEEEKREVDRLTREKASLETRLNNLMQSTISGEPTIEILRKEIDDLKGKLNEAEQNAFTLKDERDDLENKIRKVEEEKKLLENRLSDELAGAVKERQEIFNETIKTKEDFISLKKEKKNLDVRLDVATREISSLRNENEGITTKFEETEKERAFLKNEIDRLIGEKDSLAVKLSAADREKQKLNDEKDTLEQKLKETEENITVYKEKTGRLISEKESLLDKLTKAEQNINFLKKERDALETKIKEIEMEKGKLEETKKEKVSFVLPITAPNVPPQGVYVYKSQPVSFKRIFTAVVIIIVLVLGAAATFYKLSDVYEKNNAIISVNTQINPWPKNPITRQQGNFIVTVTLLSEEIINNRGIPLNPAVALGRHYYMIEIKAEEGCIPEEFVKLPSISFIGKNGVFIKMDNAGLEPTVIYKTKACDDKTGVVFFQQFASIEKNQNPEGIVIERLIRDSPMTIK